MESKKEASPMRMDYALRLIDRFPPLPKGRPFPNIEQRDIVDGLRERVKTPKSQNQGAAGLCCPAAFFFCILNYKPELYVQYVIDLYTTGKARIGSLEVKPSPQLKVARPPGDKIPPVDWVALASLRESSNWVLDITSVDDDVASGTRPAEVASWLRKIGYTGVRDEANWFRGKGRKEIEAFDRDTRMNRDVCLFINDNMLDDGTAKHTSHHMNHCVVVDEPPTLQNGRISLSVYTWGDIQRVPRAGTLSLDEFSRNFYGYVSGQPKYN